MGPPGVGKGTQGQRLSNTFRIPVVASGDMFRHVREQDGDRARQIRAYMDRGEYVPDKLTIGMVLDRLNQPDALGGFILDGFPRTVPQARALDEHLASEGRRISCVVLLQAPDDIVLERLAGRRVCENCGRVYNESTSRPATDGACDVCGAHLIQRTDETPEIQRKRLKIYEMQTAPVAAYYRETGRLEALDATKSVQDVHRELLSLLDEPVTA